MRGLFNNVSENNSTEQLVDQYYYADEIQDKIIKILADRILKRKEFNPLAIQTVLSSLLYEEFRFEDYFLNQFEILRAICLCDAAHKIPRISPIALNQTIFLNHFLSLLDVVDVSTVSDFDCADELMKKYSNFILSYCKRLKMDKDEIKEIKQTINKIKIKLGDSMAIKIEHAFEDFFGLTPEDYERWCNIALQYSPKNEKLLDIKKWCIENIEEE